MINEIYNMDCLEGMKDIPDKSVDMILCDLPYGTTRNKWDSVIDLEKLWSLYKRLIKPNGAIVLFGQGLFSSKLRMSNEEMFKYDIVWEKNRPSGFLNAKKMPLRSHEDMNIFYKKPPIYNPQMWEGKENHSQGTQVGKKQKTMNNYGEVTINPNDNGTLKYPRSVWKYDRPHPPIHPTQKPIQLCEDLVKTYTNEGDIVLDNCMGSGTTAIACMNTNRNFIGFELDETYFDLAKERILKNINIQG
jgi:site-specific DNA-methyltransferase (adenine-specific)